MARTIARNYRKNPHTANFLMTFHSAAYGLPSDIETPAKETVVSDPFAAVTETPAAAPAPIDRRSPAQAELMTKLLIELSEIEMPGDLFLSATAHTAKMTVNGEWTPGRNGNASAWITELIAMIKTARRMAREAKTSSAEIEDGVYELDGEVIKVVHAIHGSGRQYGKRLVKPSTPGENGSWEMVRGIVAKLRPEHKMSLADAERVGAIYGCCVRCGRGLTLESSIAQAMGDVCASKF